MTSRKHKISFQFSCSVVSDSLRPHESQHARPPCPSSTPGVHSDSHPSSQWSHPAISSSVVPSNVAPWKESYGKPRQCDIILTTKVRRVKGVDFLVVMYRCESCAIKKAKHRTIVDSELWLWRWLLRAPWTARRSNQSILKISPECSLEGLMLKLKLSYFGHLLQRADSLEKTLMLGKIEGRKRGGRQRMRWLDDITD